MPFTDYKPYYQPRPYNGKEGAEARFKRDEPLLNKEKFTYQKPRFTDSDQI
jgi:hypothetical protein